MMNNQKRAFSGGFPEIGRWEDFLNEIKAWSKLGQMEPLSLSYVIDLDD
ncbi:hypothetical protein K3495_g8646 [Podosphaera aphanis]|nr:hypothetical protein K3495_g8646 [Podosphaera aphanis]